VYIFEGIQCTSNYTNLGVEIEIGNEAMGDRQLQVTGVDLNNTPLNAVSAILTKSPSSRHPLDHQGNPPFRRHALLQHPGESVSQLLGKRQRPLPRLA
jgi:hypothetical protein